MGVDALLANISEGGSAAAETPAAKSAPAEAPASSGGASVDVMVPTLGESVSEATVSTWFKKVGDSVAQDEMLCELETDKVSVEVPAPAAGVLAEITAPEGTTVDASAKLGVISGDGAAVAAAPAAAPAAAETPAAASKDVANAPSAEKAMADAKAAGAINFHDIVADTGVAKVSVVGIGMRSHAGVAAKMFKVLSDEGINIKVITTSEIKISVLIDRKYMELAVQALHDAFELEKAA